jgi:hypothetical protein
LARRGAEVSARLSANERRLKPAAAGALAAAAGAEPESGYVSEWRQNLIFDLSAENESLLEREFGAGKGAELTGVRPKFCAAYSSSALAANTFARWRNEPSDLRLLRLGGTSDFDTLVLEHPCPSGLRGVPPHLDAVAVGDRGIVAVESKCTEPLTEHRAAFRDAYRARVEQLAHPSWRGRFDELLAEPSRYRFLDAAQLVKHYLGLKNTFVDRPRLTLAYLWWEPANAAELPIFADHRNEVAAFAAGLADPQVGFHAQAYPELWSEWEAQSEPAWLRGHVAQLRRRYLVDVSL